MIHILKFATFAIRVHLTKIRLWKIPTTASGRYSPRNTSYGALGSRHGATKALLVDDEIRQSLMAAPLWKYFVLKKED